MSNYQRAKKVVDQINSGEWRGVYNPLSNKVLTIKRGHIEIWVGNLSCDCVIYLPLEFDAFGLFWRHWVWFSAQKINRQVMKDLAVVNAREKNKLNEELTKFLNNKVP